MLQYLIGIMQVIIIETIMRLSRTNGRVKTRPYRINNGGINYGKHL